MATKKKKKSTKKKKKTSTKSAKPAASGQGKRLVVVESPTKAKTIRKFLPKGYKVEACVGHIRDLPASAKEIPEKFKKEKWASLGIDVENDFTPLYVVPKNKKKVITKLKQELQAADELILATDEDREGESISFHLVEILKPKVPTKRMVFHEITKTAIADALENFREVDEKLVQAQETRRILDRLVGYSLSPLVWKKIAYGLSAGRVQSVAVRLIVQRERERLSFKKGIYCGLLAQLSHPKGDLEAKLVRLNEKRIATGKDFDENTGKIAEGKDVLLVNKSQAEELQEKIKNQAWSIKEVIEKPVSRKPAPPFITSTLQQEGSRKLGMTSRETMRVAQRLYEQGFITYMRTDSTNLSKEAIGAARKQVESLYGKEYLSPEPRQYASKSKMAQEAHEAIRPSGTEFPRPEDTGLEGREKSLYELIWKRTMATQMAESKQKSVTIVIQVENAEFQSSGMRILFPGFLRAYVEGKDDAEAALEEKEVLLPEAKQGESVEPKKVEVTEHETKPPARFTEASLVQILEKEGVGRPSTYASILSTIVDRGYVRRTGNSLIPTFTAMAVSKLLENHFPELVDTQFTAEMEESLDEIAEGQKDYLKFLKDFFLDEKEGLRAHIEKREKEIDPEEARAIYLKRFPKVEFRIGRYGPYFIIEEKDKNGEPIKASIPEEIAPADLDEEQIQDLVELKKKGPPSLGKDPETGLNVYIMTGRYGPYLQLGIPEDPEERPKRGMIPKGVDHKELTLEQALGYLRLPRILGEDKEGYSIKAGQGRFGPFVVKQGKDLPKPEYRSLKKEDDVLTVDLERALELFAQPKGRGRRASTPLKELGDHPTDKKKIEVFDGPYGPYVKCGKTNASIPKEMKPEELSLQKAVELLDERKAASR